MPEAPAPGALLSSTTMSRPEPRLRVRSSLARWYAVERPWMPAPTTTYGERAGSVMGLPPRLSPIGQRYLQNRTTLRNRAGSSGASQAGRSPRASAATATPVAGASVTPSIPWPVATMTPGAPGTCPSSGRLSGVAGRKPAGPPGGPPPAPAPPRAPPRTAPAPRPAARAPVRREPRDEGPRPAVPVDRRARRGADRRPERGLELSSLVAAHVLEPARKAERHELVEDLLEPVESGLVARDDEHARAVLLEVDARVVHPVELVERAGRELEQRGDAAAVRRLPAAARKAEKPRDPRRVERRPDDERAARVDRRTQTEREHTRRGERRREAWRHPARIAGRRTAAQRARAEAAPLPGPPPQRERA